MCYHHVVLVITCVPVATPLTYCLLIEQHVTNVRAGIKQQQQYTQKVFYLAYVIWLYVIINSITVRFYAFCRFSMCCSLFFYFLLLCVCRTWLNKQTDVTVNNASQAALYRRGAFLHNVPRPGSCIMHECVAASWRDRMEIEDSYGQHI